MYILDNFIRNYIRKFELSITEAYVNASLVLNSNFPTFSKIEAKDSFNDLVSPFGDCGQLSGRPQMNIGESA